MADQNIAALPNLHTLLTNNSVKSIKIDACCRISNITAGNKDQIQNVVEANLIGPLVDLASSAEFDLKKQAARALSNLASSGSKDHIKNLVNHGCIKVFCDLLTYSDKETIVFSLRALGCIMEAGENRETEKTTKINNGRRGGVNPYVKAVDDAGEFGKLYDLLDHDDMDLFDKALELIEKYWLNPWKPNYNQL